MLPRSVDEFDLCYHVLKIVQRLPFYILKAIHLVHQIHLDVGTLVLPSR